MFRVSERRTCARLVFALCCFTIPMPALGAPWIMRHGRQEFEYEDFYFMSLPAGYRPISVNVDGTGFDQRFAAIWIKDGQNNWIARNRPVTPFSSWPFCSGLSLLLLREWRK